MIGTLPVQTDWVDEELKELDLGDQRLEMRAQRILKDFAQNPTASIPEFCGDWAATVAAYRFFNNGEVDADAVLQAQRQATLARMQAHPLVLAVQDSTSFDFSQHTAVEGAGPLDNAKCVGFLAHSTLAVTPTGVPLGLLAQEIWTRDANELGKRHQRHQRPIEDKESCKWLTGIDQAVQGLGEQPHVVVVSDRESDVFEYFVHPRPAHVDLLVRASWDRCLQDTSQNLWAAVAGSPVQGKVLVEVERQPNQAARLAACQVQYQRVKVRPPKHRPRDWPKLAPVVLWGVLIEEKSPPAGVEPLHWLLLTSLEVTSFEQACQIMEYYTLRWLIERFHFVLKSGCAIEQRQLREVASLECFLALANVVAWRLLWQTYLGRAQPDLPCTVALTEHEWKALYCFVHKTPLAPKHPPTLSQASLWIAQLGGFLARKSDGLPGVKVLWRGWRRLYDITETWLLFNASSVT
jgi:hypothetical protein